MASDILHVPKDLGVRKQYSRAFLLDIKKSVYSSDTDAYDKMARIIIEGVNRGNRNKSKPGYSKPRDNDRARDQGSIVLGPQKRTWNTGCHVSPTSTQEADSNYRSNFKGDKAVRASEYKRNGICISSRDKGVKRSDGLSFKKFSKDDRPYKNTKYAEEEPEWFSGGPTNVSETIELGGILDEIPDTAVVVEEKKSQTSCVNEQKQDHVERLNIQTVETPSGDADRHLAVSSSVETHKLTDGHGSRFKHLFSRPEVDPKDTDAINRQLSLLLKGAPKSNPTPPLSKSDVLQVEKKLRAILLGHGDSADIPLKQRVKDNDHVPGVVTLEDIEAKLIPQQKPTQYAKSIALNDDSRPSMHSQSPFSLNNSRIDAFPSLSQHHYANKIDYSNPSNVRNALNTRGMLANPMTRYPTSNNTARLEYAQRTEVSVPPLVENASSMGQSAPRYVPVTTLDMLQRMMDNHDVNAVPPLHATPLNHEIERTNAPNSSVYMNQVSNGSMHFGGATALGRPIVKGHSSSGNPLSPLLSSLLALDADGLSQPCNVKQQHTYPATGQLQMTSGKFISSVSSPLHASANNAFDALYNPSTVNSTLSATHVGGIRSNPLAAPSLPSSTDCAPNILQTVHSLMKPQSSTGSVFLTHTATADKAYHVRGAPVQRQSNTCSHIFNNMPSTGEQIRPRTLEEIEQLLRNEAYL